MEIEKKHKDIKMATIYELRLIFTGGDRKTYTAKEITETRKAYHPVYQENTQAPGCPVRCRH